MNTLTTIIARELAGQPGVAHMSDDDLHLFVHDTMDELRVEEATIARTIRQLLRNNAPPMSRSRERGRDRMYR